MLDGNDQVEVPAVGRIQNVEINRRPQNNLAPSLRVLETTSGSFADDPR
jgi:hypothetical protein